MTVSKKGMKVKVVGGKSMNGAKSVKQGAPIPHGTATRAIAAMKFNRKPGDPMFVLDGSLSCQIRIAKSVCRALLIAQNIVQSNHLANALHVSGIIYKGQITQVKKRVRAMEVTIKLISALQDMNAFSCVYPHSSANEIFLNPILLMKLCEGEQKRSGNARSLEMHINMSARFLANKVVHEVVHLINGEFGKYFAKYPAESVAPETHMTVNNQSLRFKDYGHLGEIIATGVIVESRPALPDDVFAVDSIVMYADEQAQKKNDGHKA